MYKIETSMYPLIVLANSATSIDQFHSGNTAEGLICGALALIFTGVSIHRGNNLVNEVRGVSIPMEDSGDPSHSHGVPISEV